MRKSTYLTSFLLLLSSISFAQFTVARDNGTPFVNNEIIEFNTVSNSNAELKFVLTNTSTTDLDFRIRCTNLVNNNGANFQLCFGFDCFPSVTAGVTYPDYQVIINAGQARVNLGDNFKNFNPGDGTNYPMDFTFRFLTRDLAGNPVGTNFNLTYRYQGPLSADQKGKLENMGVKVLNTFVENYVGLEINKNVTYFVANLQGQIISNGVLTSDTNLDLSTVQSGIYLLHFKSPEGIADSVKVYKK